MKARIAIMTVAAVASLALFLSTRDQSPPMSRGFDFAPGTDTLYRFEHEQKGQLIIGPGGEKQPMPVSSSAFLELELRVQGISREGNKQSLEVAFAEASRTDLIIMGENLLPDPAVLVGPVAAVQLDAQNRFVDLAFQKDAPLEFQRMIQLVLTELQLTIPATPQPKWEAVETSQHGATAGHYAADQRGAVRTRRSYQQLAQLSAFSKKPQTVAVQGAARFAIDDDGTLRSIDAEETITAKTAEATVLSATQRTKLAFLSRTAAVGTPVPLAFQSPRPLEEPIISKDLHTNTLRQRAKGMTVEKLVADVRGIGALQRMPDHNAWFTKGVAALKLEPNGVDALRAVYADAKTLPAREIVLDLLAWTGHQQAQDVLLDLIDSPDTRSHRSGHALLQRLSMVQRPSARALRFLQQEVLTGSGSFQIGAIYASGSASRKALRDGTPEQQEAAALLIGHVEQGLADATSSEMRAHFVTAIGNLGLTKHESLVIGYAASPSSKVRAHVASGLQRFDSERSRAVLIELGGDPQRRVQQRAFAALGKSKRIQDAELDRLAKNVASGDVHEEVLPVLLNAVVPYTVKTRAARAVLVAIAERDFEGDPNAKNRAYLLLARPETL